MTIGRESKKACSRDNMAAACSGSALDHDLGPMILGGLPLRGPTDYHLWIKVLCKHPQVSRLPSLAQLPSLAAPIEEGL